MAQSIPTFLANDDPTPTSYIQTARSLRLGYALRKESAYITEYLLYKNSTPPPVKPAPSLEEIKESLVRLRVEWKKEAEALYPEEGDYIVHLVDENNDPVPIGELVEYMGNTSPITQGAFPCTEYTWDLSGIVSDPNKPPIDPSIETATLVYKDCYGKEQRISDTLDNLGTAIEVCVGEMPTVMTRGSLVEVGPCDLTYKMCIQYFLDLTGVPPATTVTVNYIDCDGISTGIGGSAGTIQTLFCAQIDSITTSAGVLVLQETCLGGTPPIIL